LGVRALLARLSESMHDYLTEPDSSVVSRNPDSAWIANPKENPFVENHTQDEELKAHLLSTNEQFKALAEQHAQLKHQIEAIESKSHVTPADELEESRLKRIKLQVKDQMMEILEQSKHASVS
jgi:uncharacterized protein YdcH (DUF465 family)